jgi:protein-tyrosine phosphatase
VIDLHCHVLPGIDDGPGTIEGSLDLARAALAAGIDTLVATPHVNSRFHNDPATIAAGVEELNRRLYEEGIGVSVQAGAEIALTQLGELDERELGGLTLGQSSWLLIEPPFAMVAPGLERMLMGLRRSGHRVVLAHPERCPLFHRDKRLLASLLEAGIVSSVTAGSLVGRFGRDVRRFALELAREEMIDNVTSDAHDCAARAPGLAAELEHAGLSELTGWLTEEVPAAILADEDLPPRPPTRPARRRGWLHKS